MKFSARAFGRPVAFACFLVGALFLNGSIRADDEKPKQLKSATEDFEYEFFREVEPMQKKYRAALSRYLEEFTRAGKLDSAKEAQSEIEAVKLWRTVPMGFKKGARRLNDPQLSALQANYESAVLAVIQPVNAKFLENLSRLKEGFVTSGELDSAIVVEAEINAAATGHSLPVEAGARRYLATLSKQEFGEWIQGRTFEFSGLVAGRTPLKFDDEKVTYGAGDQAPVYEYRVSATRKIEIKGGVEEGGFTMEFSKDLHSAVFISRKSEYPVMIESDREADSERSPQRKDSDAER